MRRFFVVTAALLIGSAALVIDGCTIINGLVVPTDAARASDVPAGDTGEIDAGDGCDHARPPPPPNVADSPEQLTIVVVTSELSLLTRSGTQAVGYDLDRTCTTDDLATETCLGKKPHPDPGGRGVDNHGGVIFNSFSSLGTKGFDLEQRANEDLRAGKNAVLIRVSGYNGKPDDPAVVVSLYASPGLLDGNGKPRPPAFNESEAWALDQAQFPPFTPDTPSATTQGYVANGVVVATLDATVGLSDGLSITLTGGILTGELDLKGSKPTIKSGVIAGRWAATDILQVVARQRTSDGGDTLCDNMQNYDLAKAAICGDLDIVSAVASDRKGVACDALSVSIRFLAGPAGLGTKVPVVKDEPCPGFSADSCNGDGG